MGERLHEAHISLSLQEEAACRSEREKRSFEEEVAQLRASVQAAVAESRALQVCKSQRDKDCRECSILRGCYWADELLYPFLYRISWSPCRDRKRLQRQSNGSWRSLWKQQRADPAAWSCLSEHSRESYSGPSSGRLSWTRRPGRCRRGWQSWGGSWARARTGVRRWGWTRRDWPRHWLEPNCTRAIWESSSTNCRRRSVTTGATVEPCRSRWCSCRRLWLPVSMTGSCCRYTVCLLVTLTTTVEVEDTETNSEQTLIQGFLHFCFSKLNPHLDLQCSDVTFSAPDCKFCIYICCCGFFPERPQRLSNKMLRRAHYFSQSFSGELSGLSLGMNFKDTEQTKTWHSYYKSLDLLKSFQLAAVKKSCLQLWTVCQI